METTKIALENERKIQQLQMQAINALWKKVSTMQSGTATDATVAAATSVAPPIGSTLSDNHSQAIVQDLAKTCTVLTNQVIIIQINNSAPIFNLSTLLTTGATIARINA